MNWLPFWQKAVDYMEAHLLEKINYEDVAKEVNMSCYAFHRTFSLLAGMTANEYIRNRRLSLAGQELFWKDEKVIDVAFKYGYETPESFTKAFSRFHGVPPKKAKEKGCQLRLFNPLMIKVIMEGGTVMDYRIEKCGARKFIALVRPFANENMNEEQNNEVAVFWQECNEKHLVEKIRNLRPDGKKDLYGLCSPTVGNEKTYDYGIGIIVDDETEPFDEKELIEDGFTVWDIQSATYVVFSCYGQDGKCISDMWTRFYKEFLPQSGYEQADGTDYEIYFEKGEPGLFCEIWIPVVKE